MAAQAAKKAGAYEALLVASDGLVTEGAHTSMFAVIDGKLRTMPLSERILPGITRDAVLRLAQKHAVPVDEKPFTLDAFCAAQEAFLTSTTAEVMPVTSCDDKTIGAGEPGPITRKLQEAYVRLVGTRET